MAISKLFKTINSVRIALKQRFEHLIQHVSTFTGTVWLIVLGSGLLFYDFYNTDISDKFSKLVGIANVLVSILTTILLTTFWVIFVVKQLASSQFSPRILRHFLSNDLKVQNFIGFFIGIIALCLLPQIAAAFWGDRFLITISASIALAGHCILWAYPRMVMYLADNVNVATITQRITDETLQLINDTYPNDWTFQQDCLAVRKHANRSLPVVPVYAPFEKSGYLDHIQFGDFEEFVQKFRQKNVDLPDFVVLVKPLVGEFVMATTTKMVDIEFQTSVSDAQIQMVQKAFTDAVLKTFVVKKFRSYTQDIGFGVRKLVDIGIKAISPAVNDPTTCLNCIDRLGEIVQTFSTRQFPSARAIHLQKSNIFVNEFDFDEFVNFCFEQIFQWGKNDPIVVKRLIRTIKQLLPFVENPHHLRVLLEELDDMELQRIYKIDENEKSLNPNFSSEQARSIWREVTHFKEKARQQIKVLEEKNILQHRVENVRNAPPQYSDKVAHIFDIEQAAVRYLKAY